MENIETTPDNVNSDIVERMEDAKAFAAMLHEKLETESPQMISTTDVNFSMPEPKKKVTKSTLIEDCWRLQSAQDIPNPRPRSYFERLSKADLEEHLAHLSNRAANQLQGANEPVKGGKAAGKQTDKGAAMGMDAKMGAKALFQFNMIVCKVAELGSVNFREQLGTDLLGLGDDVMENREQLEEILAEVYREHAEMLSAYISPLNQYFMMMTAIGAGRAAKNTDRVKHELEKKQAE